MENNTKEEVYHFSIYPGYQEGFELVEYFISNHQITRITQDLSEKIPVEKKLIYKGNKSSQIFESIAYHEWLDTPKEYLADDLRDYVMVVGDEKWVLPLKYLMLNEVETQRDKTLYSQLYRIFQELSRLNFS